MNNENSNLDRQIASLNVYLDLGIDILSIDSINKLKRVGRGFSAVESITMLKVIEAGDWLIPAPIALTMYLNLLPVLFRFRT